MWSEAYDLSICQCDISLDLFMRSVRMIRPYDLSIWSVHMIRSCDLFLWYVHLICLYAWCVQLTKCECQVVNLGAGFDTQFWTLSDEGTTPRLWIEVDLDGVVSRKAFCIKSRKQLHEKLSSSGGKQKSCYHLIFFYVLTLFKNINVLLFLIFFTNVLGEIYQNVQSWLHLSTW